jgi:hypothetical protein
MEKIKNIITGVLSGAVLFMAVQVGVAHEQAEAFVDKVEVKVSTERGTLSGLSNQWVQLEIAGTPTNPADQVVIEEGNSDPDCNEPSGEICAVELNYDPSAPMIAPLLARIGGPNPPTVAEFITAGATYTGPGSTPLYTHKL